MPNKTYKFGKHKKEEFINLLKEGARRSAACEAIGISRETFRHHYKDHPDFAHQVEQSEMEANELIEDALFQAAMAGNVTAIQVWLYNRNPDRWADKRTSKVEMSGKDGKDLTINIKRV